MGAEDKMTEEEMKINAIEKYVNRVATTRKTGGSGRGL